jgi:hypothetical protein
MKQCLPLLFVLMTFVACKKEKSAPAEEADPIPEEIKAQAAEFTALIQKHEYHLTKYYSLEGIDYDTTDTEVKSETELWPYVSEWLPDDAYTFQSTGDVKVTQNAVKIPENNNSIVMARWSVAATKDGVRFNFVGHQYQYLVYRLVSFDDTKLLVWAKWNGHKVYSEFSVIE